jgi:CheY-like chemotaxis protein
MTKEIATYTVGVIGFERTERRALRRVVDMAGSRQPSFKPFDKSRGGCPHLIMVDADRPSAIQYWNRFRLANAHLTNFSPIFVGSNLADLPSPNPYVLQRPVLPGNLLAVLDLAVTEVYGFQPPAAISDGPAVGALVVEASLPVREQMRGALSSIVSRLDFAESGARALEMLDAHRYSMIFLRTLPGEDASEISGLIKKHPLQQQAVVVMLTSNSAPADRVMGILAGFDDNHLVRPMHSMEFDDITAELECPVAAV